MDSLWKDFRFATRVLLKSHGFTAVALVALVLGIGANTAIFSVVNAVLLRPLPFRDPSRLVMVWEYSPRTKASNVANPQNFADWQKRNHSFEKMAAYVPFEFGMSITGEGNPEEVPGTYVTRDFLYILGVQPALGRDFLPSEDRAGAPDAAIISAGLWSRRYGADPNIIGKKLTIQGSPTTVVGVLPASFHYPALKTDILVLYHIRANQSRGGRFLASIARLKPGVDIKQARAEMEIIARQLERENPTFDAQWGAGVVPMGENFTGDLRTPLLVLLGAVGLVLLIACANVANLMLMRSGARQREMAIRSSLGASRLRIVRQLLVESLLLGVAGGALGLFVAAWVKDILITMLPDSMSVAKVNAVTIDRNVLAFTTLLSLATGLLFGLLPALRASRPDLSDSLKEGGRAISGSLRRNRTRAALVVGEIAIALMLLIGAGLLIKSFVRLENTSAGFQPERILSMRIGLSGTRYEKPEARVAGLDEILRRVRQVPGVISAGSIQFLPLRTLISATGFWQASKPKPKPGDEPVTLVSIVTPSYFSTMGIPLVKGRLLTDRDRAGTPQVTVINQAMARQHFADADPIGQRIFVQWGRQTPYEIVGVAGDVKHEGLDKEARPTVYFPNAQEPNGGATLVIRAAADPLALARMVEEQIHSYDKEQAIAEVEPLDAVIAKSVARPRFQSVLLGIFAGLALLLAAIGIFGVMSYSVSQRTHEIGIRMALGAQRSEVLRMVVGQGLILAVLGIATGLIGAFALTRFLSTLLFNVSATDPVIFVSVPVILCAVAVVATWLPADRATEIDPMIALRYE
jgi:putative ABC transport system permease protein